MKQLAKIRKGDNKRMEKRREKKMVKLISRVRTLFQAKNSRTFQALSRTLIGQFKDLCFMGVFHFCKHFQDVFPLLTGMLALISTVKRTVVNLMSLFFYIQFSEKSRTKNQFQELSQGLEIGLLKFKGFQDAYKP